MQPQNAKNYITETEAEDRVTQFLVYQNSKYLRQNKFAQPEVSIGSDPDADLVLNHGAVADFHANLFFKAGQILLKNNKPYNGLRVNGRSVIKTVLQLWDVIDIGPFSIVIQQNQEIIEKTPSFDITPVLSETAIQQTSVFKSNPSSNVNNTDSKRYAVILKNDYVNDIARDRVADQLGDLFNVDPERILSLLERPQHILKKNLRLEQAMRLQKTLQKAGAVYSIKPIEEIQDSLAVKETIAPLIKPPVPTPPLEYIAASKKSRLTEADSDGVTSNASAQRISEDEDDEEEDLPAVFTLKQKLALSKVPSRTRPRIQPAMRPQLEIVRSIDDKVVDVQFIAKRGRYRIDHEGALHRLAGLTSFNKGYVYFPETWQGYLLSNGQQTDLKEFKTDDYLHRKRKRLYRLPLAPSEAVVVSEGSYEYQIRHSYQRISSEIAEQPKVKEMTWQHWASSVVIHLVFVLLACIFFSLQPVDSEKANLHFVKIDMSQLEQLKKKTPPLPPKKVPPKPKETPKLDMSKKPLKVKKAPKKRPPAKVVKATKRSKRISKRRPSNRDPNAGGGHGKGNVQNRNVKQTGLLSLLGNSAVAGPSEAIASITNLDAVSVPGATGKQFTVGGVKGSLGTAKISVTSGDMVQTKGTQQVLRSAGAAGPGTVAALERGQTGKKQVKGMVKARMTRTVKVEGGMSRAMVKRVIDQHLDEIQYCYESALLGNPSIMGRIVYEWKIMMSGRVGEVRIVSSSVNSHQIHDCIKSAIKTWQFPKPVGSEVIVSYPFVFDLVAF